MTSAISIMHALNPVWHGRRRIPTEKRMQTLVQTTATAVMQTTVARTTAGAMTGAQMQTLRQMQASPWNRRSGQQQMRAAG
jgi:hypothetical protein